MPGSDEVIAEIVHSVLSSPRYATITPPLVRRIALQEQPKGRDLKETVKAVKNKLHQVAGAYLVHRPNYPALLERLQAAASQSEAALRLALRQIMAVHASTRERLPILDQFYTRLLAELPPVHSILDLACGFHPLAIPWMGLSPGVKYMAVDIYHDMMEFLSLAMRYLHISAHTLAQDVLESCPEDEFDLVFLLKTIPCLEQVDKQAGRILFDRLRARRLIVSFPARSLGGKEKGMVENYEQHFYELTSGRGWDIRRFEFPSELAFLIVT